MLEMKLGENIRKLRQANGLSQQQLAEKLGYKHKSAIARIENGQHDLSSTKLSRFAKFFGVTEYELLGCDEIDVNSAKKERLKGMIDELNEEQLQFVINTLEMLMK